jgi:hypothetical protein
VRRLATVASPGARLESGTDVRVAELRPPDTLATRAAREVVAHYSSSALVNHCERAYLWSAALGELTGAVYDRELLYVASMLHDLGLMPAFDNYRAPFEDAGGDVGWVFAAGTGWPPDRRTRVKEIIVRHMWPEVDPSLDIEGHLLCEGTGLDISGRNANTWPAALRPRSSSAFRGLTSSPSSWGRSTTKPNASPGARPRPPSLPASPSASPPTPSTTRSGSRTPPFNTPGSDPGSRVLRAALAFASSVVWRGRRMVCFRRNWAQPATRSAEMDQVSPVED